MNSSPLTVNPSEAEPSPQTVNPNVAESPPHQTGKRRVQISRLKKYKSSPNMRVKVLGKADRKYETFVADSGTPVSILVNNAKKNGIKWNELDPGEPNYIIGQTTITVKFSTIKRAQTVSALVCREEGEESLIDLDTLKNMGIIHDKY